MEYETVPVRLATDVNGDHAALPGAGGGPSWIPIPRGAVSVLLRAYMTLGGGSSTVPVDFYGRDRDPLSHERRLLSSNTNIDNETNDDWEITLNNLEALDALAPYTTGSAGTFKYNAVAYFFVPRK